MRWNALAGSRWKSLGGTTPGSTRVWCNMSSCARSMWVTARKRLPVSSNFGNEHQKHHPQKFEAAHPSAFKEVMDDNKESK